MEIKQQHTPEQSMGQNKSKGKLENILRQMKTQNSKT